MNYRFTLVLDVVCHLPALLLYGVLTWAIVALTDSGFLAGMVGMGLWLRTMDWFMAKTFSALKFRWPTVPGQPDPYLESLKNQTRWSPPGKR